MERAGAIYKEPVQFTNFDMYLYNSYIAKYNAYGDKNDGEIKILLSGILIERTNIYTMGSVRPDFVFTFNFPALRKEELSADFMKKKRRTKITRRRKPLPFSFQQH